MGVVTILFFVKKYILLINGRDTYLEIIQELLFLKHIFEKNIYMMSNVPTLVR